MFTLLDYWNSVPGSAVLIESGRRIVDRRKALKINQAALLEHIRQHAGIKSRTIISEWEHGKRRIETVGQLAALADTLQCDPEYITCQCDTIRKEYAGPAERFGLSEKSFSVLEKAVSDRRETETIGSEIDIAFGITEATIAAYSPIYDTDIVDFVLGNRGILAAFRYLLEIQKKSKKHDIDDSNYMDFPESLYPRTAKEIRWRNLANNDYRFIAEQKLVEEIRKALEK